MKKILVLCSGNASRSQMAEGYLRFFAQGRAEFYSAGLLDIGINPLTIKVMTEDNIDISGSTSKTYHVFSRERFDYLLTICDDAHRRLPSQIRFRRHLHFSIPDPNQVEGRPEERLEVFRQVRETVKKHMLKFIGRELSETHEPALI